MTPLVRSALLLMGSTLLFACTDDPAPTPAEGKAGLVAEAPAQQLPRAPGPSLRGADGSIDLQKVMDRVRFAFRSEGEGYRSVHPSHVVEVDEGGFTFTPRGMKAGSDERRDLETRRLPQPRSVVEGAPVRFGAAQLFRGDTAFERKNEMRVERADGSLTLEHAGWAEHFENGREGVEQSWSFAEAPAGGGDLIVRVPVQAPLIEEDAEGLAFVSEGSLGVRYGHGTWIDAEGRKSAVPARYASGAIEMRVPEALVAASAFPAILDPVVSPVYDLGGPAEIVPITGDQEDPSVATDGTGWLVVWEDGFTGGYDLRATRVSATGEVLDLDGIALTRGAQNEVTSEVIFDGTNYLVVWGDSRNEANWDLFAARVSPAGVLLDPNGVLVAGGAGHQVGGRLAKLGSDVLVVWEDTRSGNSDIYGARISGGTVLDPGGFVIATGAAEQNFPSVASVGDTALVAWHDFTNGVDRDILATRVDATGQILDSPAIVVSAAAGSQLQPSVASDGTDYLVAWIDARNGDALDVYAARVSAAGVVQDATGIQAPQAGTLSRGRTKAVHDGTDWLVIWEASDASSDHLLAARLSAAGAWVDATPVRLTAPDETQSFFPNAVSKGAETFVVWQSFTSSWDIKGARITGGIVADDPPLDLALVGEMQYLPKIASDGDIYLVVWTEWNGLTWDIYGARVDGVGTLLDPEGIELELNQDRPLTDPAVAAGGGRFLAVWSRHVPTATGSEANLFARLVEADGSVSPSSIAVSSAALDQVNPVAVWAGANFFVAWQDSRNAVDWDVWGARITPTGSVLDPSGIGIAVAAGPQWQPALGFDGTRVIAVWEDRSANPNGAIRGARVEPSTGNVLDPSGVMLSGGPIADREPAIACEAGNCLLVWQDARGSTHWDIFGTIVPGATLVPQTAGGVGISTHATNFELSPAVAFDGANFVVVWEEQTTAGEQLVRGARVSSTGTVLEPTGFEVAASESLFPAIASRGGEQVLVAYASPDLALSPRTLRARAKIVSAAPLAPMAYDAILEGAEDTALALELEGRDAYGEALTFAIATQPQNGVLSGTAPNLTYTPNADFNGQDSFTFTVSAAGRSSDPATVTLQIAPVNDAPVAKPLSILVLADTPFELQLAGSDVDGDPLSFQVVSQPQNGTLTGTAPNLTYTPDAGFFGEDSFTYVVSDGVLDSPEATVSIEVMESNDPPVADAANVVTPEDTPLAIVLSGTDPEGSTLRFEVVGQPLHGTLTGTAPNLTYTPDADYFGEDSFTFVVDDGLDVSAEATVSITVTPVNDAPLAHDAAYDVGVAPFEFTLEGSDIEGDALTFTIVEVPAQGTVTGTPPNLTYMPPGVAGEFSVRFTASDGNATSAPATVVFRTAANLPPTVTISAEPLEAVQGAPVSFVANAVDPEGQPLTYRWTFGDGASSTEESPTHVFEIARSYKITLVVSDGFEEATASLDLEVAVAPLELVSFDVPATAEEGKIVVFAVEVKGGGQPTYEWSFGDGSPMQTRRRIEHAYADDGVYSVHVRVIGSDGKELEETREITVTNVAPRIDPIGLQRVKAGSRLTLQLRGSDVAGEADPLSWSLVEGPGSVTPDGTYTWAPSRTEEGVFTVRVALSDDDGGTTEATFDVEVEGLEKPETPGEVKPKKKKDDGGCAAGGGDASLVALFGIALFGLSRRPRRS